MFFSRKNTGSILHTRASGQQRSTSLRSKSITIGQSRKSTIKLEGSYVSDDHAVVTAVAGGDWKIENLSPNGVIVNGRKVESALLRNNDLIQIGSDNTFLIRGLANSQSESELDDPQDESEQQSEPKVNLMYVLGGVVYLLFFGYLALVYFGDSPLLGYKETKSAMVLETLEEAADDTALYLSGHADVALDPARIEGVVSDEVLLLKYSFSELNAIGSEHEKKRWVENTVRSIRLRLRNAYWLDQQGRINESIDMLHSVTMIIKDLDNPSTRYALDAIAQLKNRIPNE